MGILLGACLGAVIIAAPGVYTLTNRAQVAQVLSAGRARFDHRALARPAVAVTIMTAVFALIGGLDAAQHDHSSAAKVAVWAIIGAGVGLLYGCLRLRRARRKR